MFVSRENAVAVVAAGLHSVYCLPGTSPGAVWTNTHKAQDTRRAGKLVQVFLDAGLLRIEDPAQLPRDFLAGAL
ncbi:MAG TPA: hypothetical protein VI172_03590 [Candidatus Dormibacteraeota bacterium]|jgi:hypothetical protein